MVAALGQISYNGFTFDASISGEVKPAADRIELRVELEIPRDGGGLLALFEMPGHEGPLG